MRMYSRFVTAFVAVGALTTLVPVRAQQDARLIARVPFEFAVGDTNLPRDTYHVSRMNDRNLVLLRNDRRGVFVRTVEDRAPRDGATTSLVFHRYGNQYFLREIRWEETRFDLPETKAERTAAERRPGQAAAPVEKVVIAAER